MDQTWVDAESVEATHLARRFETAWRSSPHCRPRAEDFLPEQPEARQAVLLALLRTELTLLWEIEEPIEARRLISRHPELDEPGRVALAYEEFCLREDHGCPEPVRTFLDRYPDLAFGLKRVLEIHDLVGSMPASIDLNDVGASSTVPFPKAGQSIGGFQLVEELGRGSFARVFLARERNLADRLVALKVSRADGREPQTMARLQHTHIVPIFSCGTDALTELRLICMPYLGRVTLSQLLGELERRPARTGLDLLAALDRLHPTRDGGWQRPGVRRLLEHRSRSQVIAWWGARLAEALAHAHDHRVAHHDIKPSNILMTTDGRPMLLDFNLAREHPDDIDEWTPLVMGGTLDYMAPEQLRRVSCRNADEQAFDSETGFDPRIDLFSLGVVLYELAWGERPFQRPVLSETGHLLSVLERMAEIRERDQPSWFLEADHEVHPSLRAIIKRCLKPDPNDRYRSADQLAVDLQAVAEDEPLRHAREPFHIALVRTAKRQGLWIVGIIFAALTTMGLMLPNSVSPSLEIPKEIADESSATSFRNALSEARIWLEVAEQAQADGDFERSIGTYQRAADLLAEAKPKRIPSDDPRMLDARRPDEVTTLTIRIERRIADLTAQRSVHHALQILPLRLEHLKLLALGFEAAPSRILDASQTAFESLGLDDWPHRVELIERLRDTPQDRSELAETVETTLLIEHLASRESSIPDDFTASPLDQIIAISDDPGLWLYLSRLEDRQRPASSEGLVALLQTSGKDDLSVEAMIRRGLLAEATGWPELAEPWYTRAIVRDPSSLWSQIRLARLLRDRGCLEQSRNHLTIASALRPRWSWLRWECVADQARVGDWPSALGQMLAILEGSVLIEPEALTAWVPVLARPTND